jgi:hypothetical protein
MKRPKENATGPVNEFASFCNAPSHGKDSSPDEVAEASAIPAKLELTTAASISSNNIFLHMIITPYS